jgi:hypothetical protein
MIMSKIGYCYKVRVSRCESSLTFRGYESRAYIYSVARLVMQRNNCCLVGCHRLKIMITWIMTKLHHVPTGTLNTQE